MQCDICFRTGGHKLPFLCPTDARNVLYEPRLENARVLLEKDALDHQVTAIISNDKTAGPTFTSVRTSWDIEKTNIEADLHIDRTQQIIAQADELRKKIDAAKAEIAQKKAAIARRKSELTSASNGLEARRAKHLEDIEKKTKTTKYKWNQMHYTTTQSRAFLCAEAAILYGLRRTKETDVWLDEYSIAGIPIVDLRSMNSASAAQITTSLSHVAHLLVLSSHYLSIRLPAEITLPHRDYPLPTVLSLSSSHIYTDLPFPGTTPTQSSSNSPSASRYGEPMNLPRPRPLFINKPLPLLAKDDPSGYSLFLEGATLLAYNIAWVCRTQGVAVGTSFEDICPLGRNLYNLLIGTSARPNPASRVASATSTPTTTATSTPTKSKPRGKDLTEPTEAGSEVVKKADRQANPGVGHFSHGTAHTFLVSPEGNELLRGFKIPSPLKLADKLRSQLLTEITNAEWEVLDQEAWADDDGKELEDEGVVVGARRAGGEGAGGLAGVGLRRFGGAMQSFMSMRTVMDAVEIVGGGEGGKDRKPGTSGWTKVKSRLY